MKRFLILLSALTLALSGQSLSSQNSLIVPNGTGATVRADLNLALDTLNTLNSGPSAPSPTSAYMLWADTGAGYLKQRNSGNSGWVALRPLDPSVPLASNSGNNYSITLAPAVTSYVGGVVYKFIPNVSSTGACTLAINGLGAITIPGATLTLNQPALLIYDATDGVFVMAGGGGGGSPVGVITPYGGTSAPTGFLLCDGSAVSRTTYSSLFGVIGTTFGSGNGTTTFNVPDMRQRFPMGKAASGGTGATLGGTGGAIDHTHTYSGAFSGGLEYSAGSGGEYSIGPPGYLYTFSAAYSGTTGSSNPPFQVVNFIVKY
jgi:hypothetical protein